MFVAYRQGFNMSVSGDGSPMTSPESVFLLPAFSLGFPIYLCSALCRSKTSSLLTNGSHSIRREIPHHNTLEVEADGPL